MFEVDKSSCYSSKILKRKLSHDIKDLINEDSVHDDNSGSDDGENDDEKRHLSISSTESARRGSQILKKILHAKSDSCNTMDSTLSSVNETTSTSSASDFLNRFQMLNHEVVCGSKVQSENFNSTAVFCSDSSRSCKENLDRSRSTSLVYSGNFSTDKTPLYQASVHKSLLNNNAQNNPSTITDPGVVKLRKNILVDSYLRNPINPITHHTESLSKLGITLDDLSNLARSSNSPTNLTTKVTRKKITRISSVLISNSKRLQKQNNTEERANRLKTNFRDNDKAIKKTYGPVDPELLS
ncbi:hypothetical protein BY996DRAFT_7075285 [Phakopsora pachyrhizi]|uniref:Expressed protein n=1 Tax=Phakopsora pachyrhizi TaxID=170000 RepID=A0AAV0BQ17_PHAPC|nr:hypothetical protein BY996DRAFT_7075285 [Phakopsora pachyrhizi]CAH7688276.1 expressed protein [Phakopsora pachyrhizi]